MKAWFGTREARKCWGNEVTDTLIKEGTKPVVVVPMMFAPESHDMRLRAMETAVSRVVLLLRWMRSIVLTTDFDTKILPRIGPTAYGGEVSEGKHLGRTIRWTPQGFEWESNSKHVEDT